MSEAPQDSRPETNEVPTNAAPPPAAHDAAAPDAVAHDVAAPGVAAPGVVAPDVAAHEATASQVAASQVVEPETNVATPALPPTSDDSANIAASPTGAIPPAASEPATSNEPAASEPVAPAGSQPSQPGEPAPDQAAQSAQPATDAGIDREVADAMAAMAPEDLAALTMQPAPAASGSDGPSGVQLGRIEAVRGDDVFISLGGKSQGVISKSQFKPEESLAIGEPVEVFVDRYDRESDLLILTREGQARSVEWSLLKPGDLVEGRIVGLNRGGLEVQLKGVKAFMPASQVDIAHVKDISVLLNETVQCEVLEIDRRGKSLTVSRRKVLEKDRAARREQLIEELEVGQIRKAVVGNLTDFGAFVDLGGIDGLIHISDMSYGQVKKSSDVVKTGDVVEVKILKIQDDGGKKRISLGLKQAQPDPWDGIENRFPEGSSHRVRIVRLADFGAFAELADGIDGLIPISEMSWKRIGKPQEVVEVGQTVDISVLRVELKRHRIALSMKQAQPDPWAGVLESFVPESMVDGKVTRLTDFGAFVEIVPGVEGMIHISELADRRIKSCAEIVKPGQEVKARVLKVDSENRRIGLSLKSPESAKAQEAAQAADFGKAKPKKKNKKLRGGLTGGWDWAGTGLDKLGGDSGA